MIMNSKCRVNQFYCFFCRFLFSMERNRQLFKRWGKHCNLLVIQAWEWTLEKSSFCVSNYQIALPVKIALHECLVLSFVSVCRLFPPDLFEKFIDVGHYVRDLNAYRDLVDKISALTVIHELFASIVSPNSPFREAFLSRHICRWKRCLRCFDTVFWGPYLTFWIGS